MPTSQPGGYLICGTPRTGSTLLCRLLRSTGVAGAPESYFRLPDEPAWADRWQLPRAADGSFEYAAFVRAAVTAGSTDNGVFAARVMWGTIETLVGKLRATRAVGHADDLAVLTRAFGPLRFVYIRREDTIAQAVSWVRAEQTTYWQDGDRVPPGLEPRFDADAIRACVDTIDQHNAAWRDWFARFGVEPHTVTYEDLVADPSGLSRDVLRFLGVRATAPIEQRQQPRRQADHINRDWITRYRATSARRGP